VNELSRRSVEGPGLSVLDGLIDLLSESLPLRGQVGARRSGWG
jgi:hypothetical protein